MFSGGKDSTAMLLRMLELNYKIDEIWFFDTLLEFPEMYKWINVIEKRIGMKIHRHIPKRTWDDWFYGHPTRGENMHKIRGFPKGYLPCWWSREAKQEPMSKLQKGQISYVGIAADEAKRTNTKQFTDGRAEFRFPLVDWGWSEDDCVKYLRSKGLEHPLYKHFKRTGCWLCPRHKV